MEECRACLAKIQDDSLCFDLFRAWDPPWNGMGVSIAEDLAKLTNIQISVYDLCSKNICKKCCARLQDAINFITSVQESDNVLRKRHKDNINEAPLWPKPIQVDKSMASNAMNEMDIEIKQEVVTEDECDMNETYNESTEPWLDIKIEPEEITPAPPIVIDVNGTYGLTNPAEATPKVNGDADCLDECILPDVKEEPVSDDEMVPGMPKDCMLCMKTFSSVKELKAHVIALHSYDSVTSSRVNRINVCKTCNRDFETRTDLFVHETCHSKFACYVCDRKFESFHLLTKHRSKQCVKTSILPRLKTLDDVRRPVPVYYICDKEKPIVDSKPVSPDKPASPVTEDFINPSLSYPISAQEQLSNIKSTQESSKETSYNTEKTNFCVKDSKTERNEIEENIEQPYESTKKFTSEKTNAGVKEVEIEINKTLEESIQQPIVITCVVEKVLRPKLIENGSKVSNRTEENTIRLESIDISINTCADKDIVDSEGSNKSGQNIKKMTSDTSRIIDGVTKEFLSEAENTCN